MSPGAVIAWARLARPSFAAERDDDLAVRVELDAEAALVIGRLGLAQAGDALGGGIAVGSRLGGDFAQLGDDMGRRRAVGIAHAEVDHVLAPRPRRRLHRIDLGEDVGRQALDAVEFVGHRVDCMTAIAAVPQAHQRS